MHAQKMNASKKCNLCKKHAGAHTMHNTVECHHYKKDETFTHGAAIRQEKSSRNNQKSKKSYVQVITCMEKLEVSQENQQKEQEHCHDEESDSSNSDSS